MYERLNFTLKVHFLKISFPFFSYKTIPLYLINFFFSFQTNDDDIGDIFQDQENMAAILIRKHLQSGDLMMVSINDKH